MKILVVAATHAEVRPILQHFGLQECAFVQHNAFDVLVTGVGMTATAFAAGRYIGNHYALILNMGIAGSFDLGLPPGTVVNITKDTFSELGAQAPGKFLPIEALGFGSSTYFGEAVAGLKSVSGITVNTVHGDAAGIAEITARLQPQTESMEGAAVFFCAQNAGIPCLQVRSISNFVMPRDKDTWEITLAITNLNNWALDYLTNKPL